MEIEIIVTIIAGLLGVAWLGLQFIKNKTKTEWDDKIVDIVEGIASTLDINPDQLAYKSTGKLKEQVIKSIRKKH